jgi:wyosine [tRNA(Phe)-imidazoG37] synthetase (radical SAM superfamily)
MKEKTDGATPDEELIAFGPVPSRRLGRSLGINNIPPKICSYSCIYCQLGRSIKVQSERREFYSPDMVAARVEEKVAATRRIGEKIDYLTFVADGEPTLDIHLGEEIDRLKSTGIRIAVITNASLLWDKNLREELKGADWISLKIDTLSEKTWRKIDRPHRSLELDALLSGLMDFRHLFKGTLTTETMLVHEVNDMSEQVIDVAKFINRINPDVSYISIPTRPPAEKWVRPPNEYRLYLAYHIFNERSLRTELIVGYEGNQFARTGNIEKDILSITSVHPMREDAVHDYLGREKAGWEVIDNLIAEEKILKFKYEGNTFYVRKLNTD